MKSKIKFKDTKSSIWLAANIETGEVDSNLGILKNGWEWKNYKAVRCDDSISDAVWITTNTMSNEVMSYGFPIIKGYEYRSYKLTLILEDKLQIELVNHLKNGAILKSSKDGCWLDLGDSLLSISEQRYMKLFMEYSELNLDYLRDENNGISEATWSHD